MTDALKTILLLVAVAGYGLADPLPKDRRIIWEPGLPGEPGTPGGIPHVPIVANVTSFGVKGDGLTDDAPAFQAAIDATDSGAILIPEGSYRLASGLTIGKSIVLRGEGTRKTRLVFDTTDRVAIAFVTYQRGEWAKMNSGYDRGSRTIVVEDAHSFKPGDFAEIEQDNDPDLMYTDERWDESWSEDSVGQITTIASVDGNTLTLDRPLYLTYRPQFNPRIRTQGFVTHVQVSKTFH